MVSNSPYGCDMEESTAGLNPYLNGRWSLTKVTFLGTAVRPMS